MSLKCVHKGCGKKFSDPDEECIYHSGPPVFHEGQKGWNCCKPRFLTFDEFLTIPPCTKGKHSTVDDNPIPERKARVEEALAPKPKPDMPTRPPKAAPLPAVPTPEAEPESEDDNECIPISPNTTCRRRACEVSSTSSTATSREEEKCVYHPGHPIFHEGSKGWTCCKRRVLEFDEFMRIGGCKEKPRHMFVGSGTKGGSAGSGEKKLETVRHDFYQTGTTVHASLYLKKISKSEASVVFSSPTTIDLDLPTADKTRYKTTVTLFGPIDTEKSMSKIMGTKLELTLVKADGLSWPVLRADDPRSGEIIQVGNAGKA